MSELKLQQCRLDGRYDVLDCLGRGSYSEVYVARDVAASNGAPSQVVIKALNPYLQGMPDTELERTLIENFRNEAVALDRVRHPNIINRLGHGTAIDLQGRTFHYLVLEYLPGGDLQARCRQRPLPLEGALFYLEQVCAGLAYAHDCGVIHRDIKPQNILLTADQHTVKIADFGVAKIEAAEGAITRVGTDIYAAPEHHPLAQTGPLDTASLKRPVMLLTPAADVYSLAKTAYMMLTGEAPRRFSQKAITSLPSAQAAQPWATHVVRVLEKATRTNPDKRYRSVKEFWEDMKDAALPVTRTLRKTGELPNVPFIRPHTDRGPLAPAPPAPNFGKQPDRGNAHATPASQRIVVPVAPEASRNPSTPAQPRAPQGAHAPRGAAHPEPHAWQTARGRWARLSPGTRNWIVAGLLLAAFALMLFATHTYVSNLRSANGSAPGGQNSPASPIGREFVTTTDVNLRSGPGRNFPPVGLAEMRSVVRVTEANGSWYQVTVLEHGRPKEKTDSADQGWAHSSLLKAK